MDGCCKAKTQQNQDRVHLLWWKTATCQTRRYTININGKTIQCTNKIKYLGGHLDSSLTLKDHIIAKSKAATIYIIKIRNIRKYLNQDICHKLVVSLVLSHPWTTSTHCYQDYQIPALRYYKKSKTVQLD